MAVSIGELMASVKLDTSAFEKSLNGLEKSVSGIGSVLKGGALTALGGSLTKSIWQAGSSFASQMSMVKAVSGATGREFKQLEQAAIRMGSTTKFTATEAGEALQYMGMAGWEVEDMLNGLPSVMALAAASGEELGTVSDIVTDAMTALGMQAGYMVGEVSKTSRIVDERGITHYFDAYGKEIAEPIEQTQHFSDVLAQAAMSSNTNIKKMGETFKYAAPLAGALGYSAEDTALAIGLMANAGIKSSQAGTSLRMLFTNLATPSDKMTKALKEMGVSLTDTAGNMLPLRDVLKQLQAGFQTLTPAEQTATAELLAGKRAMSGLLAIVNSGDEFDRLAWKIDNCNGAASRMETTAIDNAAGAWTIFKSAVEGANISLFKLSEQDLTGLIKTATELVDWFNKADDAFKKGIRNLILMGTAIGPLVLGAGSLQLLAPAIMSLASPIGMMGTAMALLGVGMSGVGDDLVRGIGRAVMEANTLIQSGTKRMNKALAGVEKSLRSMANVKGVFGNMRSMTAKTIKEVAGLASNIIRTLARILPDAGKLFTGVFRFLGTTMAQHLPEIADAMADLAVGIVEIFTNGEFLSAFEDVGKAILEAFTRVDPAAGQNAFEKILGKLLKPLQDPAQIKNTIQRLAHMLIHFITGTDWKGAWKTLTDALATVDWADLAKTLLDALRGIGKALFDTILDGETLTGFGQKIHDKISKALSSETFVEVGKNILAGIRTGLEGIGELIRGLLLGGLAGENIGELIRQQMASVDWASVGTTIHDEIEGAVSFAESWLTEKLIGNANQGNIWSGLGAAASRLIKESFDIASDFLSGLILGRSGEGTDWTKEGAAIAGGIQSGMESVLNAGTSFLVGLLTGDAIEAGTWTENADRIIGAIRQAFTGAQASLGEFLFGKKNQDGTKEFDGFIDSVVQSFRDGISKMTEEENPLRQFLDGILDSLVKLPVEASGFGIQMAAKLMNAIAENVNIEKLGTVFGSLAESIGTALGEAFASLGQMTAGAMGDLADTFAGGKGGEAISGAEALGKGIVTGIANAIKGYASGASMIWDAIANILTMAHEGNVADAIASSALAIAKTFIETLTASFSLDGLVGSFGSLAAAVGRAMEDAFLGASRFASGAIDLATAGLKGGGADGAISVMEKTGIHIATALVEAIRGGLTATAEIADAVARFLEASVQTDFGGRLGTAAASIIGALIESLQEAVSGKQIEEIFTNVGQSLGDFAETAGDFAGSIAEYFMANLPEIFNAGVEIAGQLASGIIQGLLGLGDGILHALLSVFKGALRGIASLFGLEFNDTWDMVNKAQIDFNGQKIRGDKLQTEYLVNEQGIHDAEEMAAAYLAVQNVLGDAAAMQAQYGNAVSASDVTLTRAIKDTERFGDAQRGILLAAGQYGANSKVFDAMYKNARNDLVKADFTWYATSFYDELGSALLNGGMTESLKGALEGMGANLSGDAYAAFETGLSEGRIDADALMRMMGIAEIPATLEAAMANSEIPFATGMNYDSSAMESFEREIMLKTEGLKKEIAKSTEGIQTAEDALAAAVSMDEVAEAFETADDLYDWIQVMGANGTELKEVFSAIAKWMDGQDGVDLAAFAQSFAEDFEKDIWGDDELAARIREFFAQYAEAVREGRQEVQEAESENAGPAAKEPETVDLNLDSLVGGPVPAEITITPHFKVDASTNLQQLVSDAVYSLNQADGEAGTAITRNIDLFPKVGEIHFTDSDVEAAMRLSQPTVTAWANENALRANVNFDIEPGVVAVNVGSLTGEIHKAISVLNDTGTKVETGHKITKNFEITPGLVNVNALKTTSIREMQTEVQALVSGEQALKIDATFNVIPKFGKVGEALSAAELQKVIDKAVEGAQSAEAHELTRKFKVKAEVQDVNWKQLTKEKGSGSLQELVQSALDSGEAVQITVPYSVTFKGQTEDGQPIRDWAETIRAQQQAILDGSVQQYIQKYQITYVPVGTLPGEDGNPVFDPSRQGQKDVRSAYGLTWDKKSGTYRKKNGNQWESYAADDVAKATGNQLYQQIRDEINLAKEMVQNFHETFRIPYQLELTPETDESGEAQTIEGLIAELISSVNANGASLNLSASFASEMEKIREAVDSKADEIEARLASLVRNANDTLTGVTFGAGDGGGEPTETGGTTTTNTTNNIQNTTGTINLNPGAIAAQINEINSIVVTGFGRIVSNAKSAGTQVGRAFIDGLNGALSGNSIGTTVGKAFNDIAKSSAFKTSGRMVGISFGQGIVEGIQSMTSAIRAAAEGALDGITLPTGGGGDKNAWGGYIAHPVLSWVGEDGPEMIIPLGADKRSRGLSLWERAGDMLGAFSTGNLAKTVENIGAQASIGELSRGSIRTDRQNARATGDRVAARLAETEKIDAAAIGNAIADRLIASGALKGDVYLNNRKVGRLQSPVVSETIANRIAGTIAGKAALGVME